MTKWNTPEPKAIISHSKYVDSVRSWHKLHGKTPPFGGAPAYPGPDYSAFIGTKPEKTFSWVNYAVGRDIYIPAHCLPRIMLLISPHAETLFKAYCAKHGLGPFKQPDSAFV